MSLLKFQRNLRFSWVPHLINIPLEYTTVSCTLFLNGVSLAFEKTCTNTLYHFFSRFPELVLFYLTLNPVQERERQSSKTYSYFGIMLCACVCVYVCVCVCVSQGILGENLNMKHSFEVFDVCRD